MASSCCCRMCGYFAIASASELKIWDQVGGLGFSFMSLGLLLDNYVLVVAVDLDPVS